MNALFSTIHYYIARNKRRSGVVAILLFCLALIGVALAAGTPSISTSFTPADSSRTYMDIGGVWNGTTEVTATTGDKFGLTITNPSDSGGTLFNARASITLPAGFHYVSGTASGVAGITASQSGQTLTFTMTSVTRDIAAGSSRAITYGLYADSTVAAGTVQLAINVLYKNISGGADQAPLTSQQNVVVANGATVITKTPSTQTKAVNQSATWTVTVANNGLGGLFNVPIDESAINPGSALQLTSITTASTAVATKVGTGSASVDKLTVPYLAPGASFTATVMANVTACGDIKNTASTTDRTGATNKSTFASIVLDLKTPLVTLSPANYTLNYSGTIAVSIPITNTGLGDATGFVLHSNLPSLNVAVSNLASGWSYNSGTGDFTLNTSSGLIANSTTTTLTFNIATAAGCPTSIGGTVIWKTTYKNLCGDIYNIPTVTSTINPPSDMPGINLNKTVSADRLNVGESGSYTLSLNASNPGNFKNDSSGNVVVTDTLPASGLTNIIIGTPTGGTVSLDTNTNILTWTIPKNVLVGNNNQSVQIGFNIGSDPCLGGTSINNTATATVTTAANCQLNSSSNANILIANNPGVNITQQYYNVNGGNFETGNSSADATRDTGEGEFIPITASYAFGAGSGGTFSGSTYVDNYGGLAHQTLVPGTLMTSVNGGTPVAVPGGSFTQNAGQLTIDLGFLAGMSFANTPNVEGQSFAFTYKTTVPDQDLPLPTSSRSIVQIGTLTVASGSGGGACGTSNTFRHGDTYSISRAAANISVSLSSNNIEKCQTFPVTLTVSNGTAQQARNVLTTFLTTGNYSYPTSQTPTYGGIFSGGNIAYNENSGNNPTFTFTGGPLTGNGTITFNVQLKGSANTTPAPVSAKVDYDDNQTVIAVARVFQSTGSVTPSLVRSGNLQLRVSPQNINVTGNKTQYKIYVTNTGDGTAYNATLQTVVPAGLTPDVTDTNNLNPSFPLTTPQSGQTMIWNLHDMTPGQTVLIYVAVDVDGSVCGSIAATPITAKWGCDNGTAQTQTAITSNFNFPAGQLQVLHDSSNTYFTLCANGYVVIIARNVGLPHIYNGVIKENLQTDSSGIALVLGTVEYSIDGGGSYTAGSDPTGAGTSADPYVWTKNQIAPLADLAPVSENQNTPQSHSGVRIRFQISSTPAANAAAPPTIKATGAGTLACGGAVGGDSNGVPYTIPARRPDITVTKTGANLTAQNKIYSTATYSGTVYSGVGDSVAWRVQIKNNGNMPAEKVQLTDIFPPGNNVTSGIINGPGVTNGTITSNVPFVIPDANSIAAGATATYYVTETLGNACVDADNTASVTWACPVSGIRYSGPTKNTDTAHLVMTPDFSGVNLTQGFTTSGSTATYNGRVKATVTITNAGGPATAISLPMTMPAGMDLDQSVAPAITSNTSAVPKKITSLAVTGTNPSYTFTFNSDGWLRNGQSVTVTYYLIQKTNFDNTANGGVPLVANPNPSTFQSPETTANGLDPALPASGNVVAEVDYKLTCGTTGTPVTNSRSVDPLTPDLDITVTNLTQTVQTGQTYALNFFFLVTNAGDTNSVADHITFSLPFVGDTWNSITITGPNGETASSGSTPIPPGTAPSITLINTIKKGNSVVVQVNGVTKPIPATGLDLRLIGQVEGRLFNQSGADTGNNYSLDRAAPTHTSDVSISGYVYLDANVNAQRDAGENGTGKTLYAKLIPNGGTSAITVVPVNTTLTGSTSGFYLFTGVSDTLSPYRIIIDDNATATDITPISPGTGILAGYAGTEAPTMERTNVIVGATDFANQNFGLFRGNSLSGTVFKDDGIGGGVANDGIQNGGELGISGVSLKVTNSAGNTIYDTATTDSNGDYTLYVPESVGNNSLKVVETNLSRYTSTGASFGNTGGSYNRGADTVTFTNAVGTIYTGVDFGDVPPSTLTIDGNKTLAPGGTAFFPHVFTAGTGGAVTFSVTDVSNPLQTGWTNTLFQDTNGDGVLQPGEPPVTGAINVTAGVPVHLLIQVFAPANATNGAQDVLTLTADLAYANATPTIHETLMRSDVATVSPQSELQLQKAVDKATALSGDNLTYTITYNNNSAQPLTNLIILDNVPAYTKFVSASYTTTPPGLTNGTLTAPTPGAAGTIKWTFTGSLMPGQTGTVTFVVKVVQ